MAAGIMGKLWSAGRRWGLENSITFWFQRTWEKENSTEMKPNLHNSELSTHAAQEDQNQNLTQLYSCYIGNITKDLFFQLPCVTYYTDNNQNNPKIKQAPNVSVNQSSV